MGMLGESREPRLNSTGVIDVLSDLYIMQAFLDMFFHCCSSPRKRTWAYQHDECPFMTSRHPCSRNCRRTASAARANVPSVTDIMTPMARRD
jgi:hypothetical protein